MTFYDLPKSHNGKNEENFNRRILLTFSPLNCLLFRAFPKNSIYEILKILKKHSCYTIINLFEN